MATGTYILVLHLAAPRHIGRFGTFAFPAGYCLYVGSAFGPGGLEARIDRHRRARKKPYWLIDHLRRHAGHEGRNQPSCL